MSDWDGDALRKEKFLILYNSYARAYERFLENGFKASAALLVVLGWLLGSENARTYLAANDGVRWMAIGEIFLGAVFLVLVFRRLACLSRALSRRLDALAFVEPELYGQHRIPPLIYWSVVGQNLLVCILIAGILLRP